MAKESKTLHYTATGARILLGLVFFVFGFGYFFMGDVPLDTTTPGGQFAAALIATGYFFTFLKIIEGVAGFMLFFKRWTPLALVILAPIVVNILMYAVFLAPEGIVISVLLVVLEAFLAWYNWDKYAPLFSA